MQHQTRNLIPVSVPVLFRDTIQPIFAARCVICHGGTIGLTLDTYGNVIKGGVNGAVYPSASSHFGILLFGTR